MKQSKIECLSKSFRSTDPLREKLHRMFPVALGKKEYSCATNAGVLILIPCTDWTPEKRDNDVNACAVIPEFDSGLVLKTEKLEGVFNSIPEHTEQEEKKVCSLCANDGYFSIGGEDYKCQSCNNDTEYMTIEHIKSDEKLLKFEKKYFIPSTFQPIFDVIQFMDVSEIIIKTKLNDSKTPMVVELEKSGILMLIMPYVRTAQEFYEIT